MTRATKRICTCTGCQAHQGTCPTIVTTGRCTPCAATARARRPNQHAYGWEHQQARDRIIPQAIGKLCPRCGQPMLAGQRLQLGHTEDLAANPGSRPGDRAEHARCNESAGGTLGRQVQS